jgi:predicted MFS family arabinose efflux permease
LFSERAVGLTASTFGLGGTLSNFLGQHVVESFGHVVSLSGSLILSFIPLIVFGCFMPETLGDRGSRVKDAIQEDYVEMTQ